MPVVWLDVVWPGRGREHEYQIAVRLSDEGEFVHISADDAHELAARLILLARIVDPEGKR
jgi:hypothetical protein